jgi:hypothetical protein
MTESDKIGFFRAIFEREQSRKLELDNAINLPITIATGLGGLIYFFFDTLNHNIGVAHCCLSLILLVLTPTFFVFSAIAFLFSLFFLASSLNNFFSGFEYPDFPKTKDLHEYLIKVQEYEKLNNATSVFDDYLIKKYVDFSDRCIVINDKRSLHLHYAKTSLILTLFLLVISAILLGIKLKYYSHELQ